MKPTLCTQGLHRLHGQFVGTHILIFALNEFKDLQLFISFGIISQIFGAK